MLGNGVRDVAEILGGSAEEFAIHTKGLEFPYHDPRAFIDMAANYATGNRGSCHLESFSYPLGYGVRIAELGYDKLGVSRKDDTLPKRLLTLDRKEGTAAGSLPDLERLLDEYCQPPHA